MLLKAVVTGANGFIAPRLISRLMERGIETIAIVKNESKLPCKTVIRDLTNQGALDDILSTEFTIFHLAGIADVAASVNDPQRDFDNNLKASFNVLESARKCGAKFIFPSTASVYDYNAPLPLTEDSIKKPSSPYGSAKLAMESYCQSYHRTYDMDCRIVRLFSVYGIGMQRFMIYDLVNKILSRKYPITLYGTGEQIRDYMHVDDVVEAMLAVVERGLPGNDYNIASGNPVKIKDLALYIAEIMDLDPKHLQFDGIKRTGEVEKWYGDPTRLASLGFTQNVKFNDGLRETIEWISEQKK